MERQAATLAMKPDANADERSPRPDSRRGSRVWGTDTALQVLLVLAVLVELGVVFVNTLMRSFLGAALAWTPEAAQMALAIIAFLGGALAYRRGEHAHIRTVIDALRPEAQRVCHIVIELLVLLAAIMLGISAFPLLSAQWNQVTPILHLSVSWFIAPIVLGAIVFALSAIERLAGHPMGMVLRVGVPFCGLTFGLLLTHEVWQAWFTTQGALALALGLFVLMVLIGLPVGFALLLGALSYVQTTSTVPMPVIAQIMSSGANTFVLLALPFFILAAIIMNQGGISLRLVRLVQVCVGRIRGGLLQVLVVSMYIVSGLSGSKMADVAAVGSVMREMLRREGYSLEQSAAILAASAAMGETVPPSIAILVLGAITMFSMGTLFIAGIIPAAVIGLCLMVLIYIQSLRQSAPRAPRVSMGEILRASAGGILPLLMPVILFGGVLLGIATPTEVSSFAVMYGLLLGAVIYRELSWRQFIQGVVSCATTAGMMLFIIAAASSFAWMLTVANLPHRLVALMAVTHQSQSLFLVATIVLLIVTGSILEGLPALLILTPILMPIATQIGVSPIHYGIVLVIAMGIGFFIPPLGIGFYITCAICETSIEQSTRQMIPYIVVLCLGLVLVALIPWFTLFLPTKFHLVG